MSPFNKYVFYNVLWCGSFIDVWNTAADPCQYVLDMYAWLLVDSPIVHCFLNVQSVREHVFLHGSVRIGFRMYALSLAKGQRPGKYQENPRPQPLPRNSSWSHIDQTPEKPKKVKSGRASWGRGTKGVKGP